MPSLRSNPAGRSFVAFCLMLLMASAAGASVRLMTWNLLNYPTSNGDGREPDYRTVLAEIVPDLLVVQEISSAGGPAEFLSDVLDTLEPGQWAQAPFSNGPDTDNACFYRASVLNFVSNVTLSTSLREIDGWEFRPDGAGTGQEFWIWSLHLKAGNSGSDESERFNQADVLRNYLNDEPAGTPIIVGGDYNFYNDSEQGWIELTGSQVDNDGRLFDPISTEGSWHDNASFADVHTQSTRTTSQDGGATGGMDDRFDFLLVNDDLLDGDGFEYVSGSYTAFGQDGNHFNQAINSGTNGVVSASVANALHDASDHLPVYFDMDIPASSPSIMTVTSGPLDLGQAIVNAVGVTQSFTVQNDAVPPADDLDYSMNATSAFSVPAGMFQVAAGDSANHDITLDASVVGPKNGSVTVSGDDPSNPEDTISVTAHVVNHARPSTEQVSEETSQNIFMGAMPAGSFSDVSIEAHNYLYGSNSAQMDVYALNVTGADADKFSVTDFSQQIVGATPATYTVHFDDSNVSSSTAYVATITLSTRDEAIPGATDLDDLVYEMAAFVTTTTDAPRPLVARTWLHENYPNPFNPATTIAYDIVRPTSGSLSIFNVRGRLIRVLVEGELQPGRYREIWDGKSRAGISMPSGVYFYRLRTEDLEQTRRMNLVR